MEEDACHTVNAQNVISKMRIHKGPRAEVIKVCTFHPKTEIHIPEILA